MAIKRLPALLRAEWVLGVGIATALAFLLAGDSLYGESPSTLRQLTDRPAGVDPREGT